MSIPVRAKVRTHHERAYDYDEKRGLWLYKQVDEDEEAFNILTDTGRVQLHNFGYGLLPRLNGFNWIGLSDDASIPTASDTALTAELTVSGLGRYLGTVTLPTGAGNVTTVSNVFTYTGLPSQSVRKTALFDSPVLGVMNHEILFSQRVLVTSDTLGITIDITLG
jgi:hypothetical protein